MAINRRDFFKIIGISALMAASPAFSNTRLSFVTIDSGVVDYIGANKSNFEGFGKVFSGGRIVRKVHAFDGIGYPIELASQSFNKKTELYYDFDLSDMCKDVPDKFWGDKENCKKYPNVHTYIREQRFGESVSQAIDRMRGGQALPKDWEQTHYTTLRW